MAARWFDRLRNGSCGPLELKDSNCGRDQMWIFESSEPVARCKSVAAKQVTGWRCAGEVEICLPVKTYIIRSQSLYHMIKTLTSHSITLPSAVPSTSTPSPTSAALCIRSGNEINDSWVPFSREYTWTTAFSACGAKICVELTANAFANVELFLNEDLIAGVGCSSWR
jgi:hypothetical protein